jgi:hypothetical protein
LSDKDLYNDNWNIHKFPFPQGDDYLEDLQYIKFADSGLIADVNPFYFVNEACQLLANAVKLFEDGYFDCAFYSIRQSLEITVSGLYLFSNPNKLKNWQSLEDGFEAGRMISSLEKNQQDFKEIRNTFKDFFKQIRNDKKRMNKYIHKQGFTSLYVFYNGYLSHGKPKIVEQLTNDFENILKESISAAAIYRLVVDPYPILMLDDDIVSRMPDIVAERYPTSFVEKYLCMDFDFVEKYKKTSIYQGYYDYFKQQPLQNEAVYALMHWQLFERKDYDDIIAQQKLLTLYDKEAVELFMLSEKIGRIMIDGCFEYNCETRLNNTGTIIGESYYSDIFVGLDNWNISYNGDLISRCSLNDSFCYIFHNAPFSEDERQKIISLCSIFTDEFKIQDKVAKDFFNKIQTT